MVRAIPALLGTPDVKKLVTDIAEELVELGGSTKLEDQLIAFLQQCHATVRCVRAGP